MVTQHIYAASLHWLFYVGLHICGSPLCDALPAQRTGSPREIQALYYMIPSNLIAVVASNWLPPVISHSFKMPHGMCHSITIGGPSLKTHVLEHTRGKIRIDELKILNDCTHFLH